MTNDKAQMANKRDKKQKVRGETFDFCKCGSQTLEVFQKR